MSEHIAKISWSLGDAEFTYRDYSRSHEWLLAGDQVVRASAAPAYRGDKDRVDPEQAFVASLASCHMLTFLALAATEGVPIQSYNDEAVGYLEKDADGKMAVTRVVLNPEVTFPGDPPSEDVLRRLHHEAHEQCFIANSVKTEVRVAGYH